MPLTPGTKLAVYEILGTLGRGGMGEVYRALDTKLGREVAIKVLPEAFSKDKDRLARFEREARLLASLNHPGIATLYGLEESDGQQFLVMELVEGETLAARIARGPIPIDEALRLFAQIAEALEAAHEKGVVHRDLKPANIMITPEGKPKVLDFGLAKAVMEEGPSVGLSESPTVARGTADGVILGTAPYMSPEQARGKSVDRRADIWAYGCCLYESLTGEAVFLGETVSDTIAKILEREPDWSALPERSSRWLHSLLRRCLQKDPARRLRDIGDARIEVEEELDTPLEAVSGDEARASRPGRNALPWVMSAVAVALAGLALWAPWRGAPVRPAPVVRTNLTLELQPGESLPELTEPPILAISPDGTRLVYAIRGSDGVTRLYSKELEAHDISLIPGTDGARGPFFSPDSQWLGFEAGGQLKKIQLDRPEAGVVDLYGASKPLRGASWGPDGRIVFGLLGGSGLMRISDSGGTPEALTSVDPDALLGDHRWPHVLPTGKGVIFSILTGSDFDESRIVAQSFETGERKFLINASYARYASTGHLIYAREDTLYAAPFDLDRMELRGTGIPVQAGVRVQSGGPGSAHFSLSDNGTLLYLERPERKSRLFLVDLRGEATPLPAPPLPYGKARFSPDGRRLAVSVRAPGAGSGIYVWELDQERLSLMVSQFEGPSGKIFKAGFGEWSPDGRRLVVNGTAPGEGFPLFALATDGSSPAERLTGAGIQSPNGWSADGKRILFTDHHPSRDAFLFDIFELDVEARTSRGLFEPSRFKRGQAALSPDGRWLAYTANASGRDEVYITSYERPGGRQQLSTQGGTSPIWSPDGGRLYYRNGARVMAIDMIPGRAPSEGAPRLLFEGRYRVVTSELPRVYDLSPDGTQFVMIRDPEAEFDVTQFQLVINWFQELERLVPTN